MAPIGSTTDAKEINYKFACRCCLKSEAEFFKLDSLTESAIDENTATSTKIPLIRLLLFCMRTENLPELPQYICVECSKGLKIAYFFIQNSLRAHEILCRKLCPSKLKSSTRLNGQQLPQLSNSTDQDDATPPHIKRRKSNVRHECKVCGAIIYTRLGLKQHIRMHTEASNHKCKLCSFNTLNHRQLPDHYRIAHGLTAEQIEQQLKLRSMQAVTATTSLPPPSGTDDGQVKVCTLEDMELLIPTVLTPEDFTHPQLDADQLRAIEQQLANAINFNPFGTDNDSAFAIPDSTISTAGNNNMSVGAEFLVLPDGTLQQVNDAEVVFEYIDDSKIANSTTNVSLHNLLADSNSDLSQSQVKMDTNTTDFEEELPHIRVKPKLRPAPGSSAALKHKCKLCPKAFPTIARLKSHQLTHSHLPKFYCDLCAYCTLRSAELMDHYTVEHNSVMGQNKLSLMEKPLQPFERGRIYSCDMCLYEATSSGQLRAHYSKKHQIQPSEIQLRPSWTNESMEKKDSSARTSGSNQLKDLIPLGIQYPTASVPTAEIGDVGQNQSGQATTTAMVTQNGEINVVVDATSLFYAAASAQDVTLSEAPSETLETDKTAEPYTLFPEQSFANSLTTTTITEQTNVVPSTGVVAVGAMAENPGTNIFGDMQEFIDNTDVAAICTIPADDMPVVDGDDIVIDNNNMSLDFDAENLFEEFDEDVEQGDDDDDEVENDDENDNNDAEADQNLLLTSDDDDVDDFDDEQSKHLQKPYCIYCNKKFTSQYKFENHMFVHRGLAPYRCELCTNLYNMKRLLIRHYKTVHKRMPTRDMVQAKGDKVHVPRTTIEKLNINVDKSPMLMCAKCPFECEHESDMRTHLNSHHGINDGVSVHANEVFMIRKLPYECPRCIRTFAAKRTLVRHLQRSHLVDTLIEMQAPQLTTSSLETSTTSTATTTLLKNDFDAHISDSHKAIPTIHQESMIGSAEQLVPGYHSGDGKDQCGKSILSLASMNSNSNSQYDQNMPRQQQHQHHRDSNNEIAIEDTDVKIQNTDIEIETNLKTDEIVLHSETTPATVYHEETTISGEVGLEVTPAAALDDFTKSVIATPLTETSTSVTTAAALSVPSSTLFPAPTPFEFELDFIVNEEHGTPIKNNDSFSMSPSPRQLLNVSDKFLTAALEPSPNKELRSRLPRTPIFVCKQCNQTFDELQKLSQHESEHHSSTTVSPHNSHEHQCKYCNTTYRTVTLLNYHMKHHLADKVQSIPKHFEPSADLGDNAQTEQRSRKPLKCGMDDCKKTFRFKHHLKRHQTASHMAVQYLCPLCGRDMLTSLSLRNHMASHKSTHLYRCPKCVRTYMRRNPFRKHALREHRWELTDAELDKIHCLNESSGSNDQISLIKMENEQSD